MCLLREAAHAWQQLTGTEYRITVGRRGKKSSFALSFSFADFPHVAGMQYAQDVDFGLRPSEYYGERLIPSILSGKLEAANMERSRNWLRIKGRLNAIIHLQETLDTEFLIARFRPNLVRIHCKIDAQYIIKNLHSGEVFFVFIDKGTGQRYYCKSAFERTTIDYLENQAVLTVLKKEKVMNGIPTLLYLHPNYMEDAEA